MRQTKKIFSLITFFIAILVLFNGCFFIKNQSNENPDIGADDAIYETRIGIIKPIDLKGDLKRGTHLLFTTDDKSLILESQRYDLNSNEYLYKKVEVRGPFLSKEIQGTDLLIVENITVLENTPTELEPDNVFRNYFNELLGFKINYKGVLQIEDKSSLIWFIPIEEIKKEQKVYDELIEIALLSNPKKLDLKNWLIQEEKIPVKDQIPSQIGEMKLAAIQVLSEDKNKVSLYVARENYVYRLSHSSKGGSKKNDYRNLFYEMVPTFSFIEPFKYAEKKTTSPKQEKTESTKTEDPKGAPDAEHKSEEKPVTPEQVTTDEKKEETTSVPPPTKDNNEAVSGVDQPAVPSSSSADKNTDPVSADKEKVIAYVQSSINEIAPEKPTSGAWKTTQFEFTDPDYVYTEYKDNVDRRKVLLKYQILDKGVSVNLIGYYKPGEDKDWETVSGTNEAAGKSREVITVNDTGTAQKSTVVKEGYRYLESIPYNFKIQYPGNWYYNGSSGRYTFTDKPNNEGQELVGLSIVGQSLTALNLPGESLTIGNKKALKVTEETKITYYLEKSDGKTYKLEGNADKSAVMQSMAETIED